ncbi:hypothetical protein ACQUSY_10680 [Microbacterium sp. YY-03]|uniref:hypothetical protein n=1 Tax=Microbacterium sp. YY-03 TaxID=3421636 RepID=UPI003D186383
MCTAVVVVPEPGAQFWSELARVGTMGARGTMGCRRSHGVTAEPWGDGGTMG